MTSRRQPAPLEPARLVAAQADAAQIDELARIMARWLDAPVPAASPVPPLASQPRRA